MFNKALAREIRIELLTEEEEREDVMEINSYMLIENKYKITFPITINFGRFVDENYLQYNTR